MFGGWAFPPSYPLYQTWQIFNELHVYDIIGNQWTCVNTTKAPPPSAGHSASVVGEWMIIFGGFQRPNNAVHSVKSNDVWKLNLQTWTWYLQEVEGNVRPQGRLGQTQVVLDEKNLLIMGGSGSCFSIYFLFIFVNVAHLGGPTINCNDAWILNMEGDVWRWKEVVIEGRCNKPNSTWTNPGCKVCIQSYSVNGCHDVLSLFQFNQ